MLTNLKRYFKKVKKILSWLPVLWKDEDWDYEYILDILYHKVKTLDKTLVENDLVSNIEQIHGEMQEFLKAIYNFQHYYEIFEDKYKDPEEYAKITGNNADDFYLALYEYEGECWNKIWELIQKNGRNWWD